MDVSRNQFSAVGRVLLL